MEIRGILHCHSTYSYDAKLSLRELKDLCVQNGVGFVCMTEHVDEMTGESASEFVRECEALSDATFCFIPGFEVPYKVNAEGREGALGYRVEGSKEHAHILMVGMREFLGNYAPNIDALKKWTEKASFVVLAHPVRNQFIVDSGMLHEIDALEVWNQQYEGKRVPRTRSLALLSELRAQKSLLLATGGVDLHRTEHMGSPLVTMEVDTLSESTILEKLQKGAYIVSSPQSTFLGTLPNIQELIKKHRFESALSVLVIVLGKFVNKVLATFGLKLPKSLKQIIRKRL